MEFLPELAVICFPIGLIIGVIGLFKGEERIINKGKIDLVEIHETGIAKMTCPNCKKEFGIDYTRCPYCNYIMK